LLEPIDGVVAVVGMGIEGRGIAVQHPRIESGPRGSVEELEAL
jgi:hypothetical protein